MSSKIFNNLLKKMENNPNRYKPVNKPAAKSNKDDGQKYLKDLGKLLCVVVERVQGMGLSATNLQKVYTGNWYDIILKLMDNTEYDFRLEFDIKTNGRLYEDLYEDEKNTTSEANYYKMNPKLIFQDSFESTDGETYMFVVPMSEVEDLDASVVGGRRRKTLKNKRK